MGQVGWRLACRRVGVGGARLLNDLEFLTKKLNWAKLMVCFTDRRAEPDPGRRIQARCVQTSNRSSDPNRRLESAGARLGGLLAKHDVR